VIRLDFRTPTGRWRHGLFWQICQNILWFCKHGQKGRNRKAKSPVFSLNYKSFHIQSGFEQLSSSICWRVMATWKSGVFHPRLGFVGAEIFTKFSFFVHNFGYRYARKSFKGSKDADFGLVSKTILSQNNGSMGWGPEPGKNGQKSQNTRTCGGSPANPKPKTKNVFFRFQAEDLLNPRMVWIAL